MPRAITSILVAGVSSGCGKTTVSLGLMAALRDMGLKVQPFKCGPDFIDPTLHEMITGRPSWNLDIRMCGEDYVKALFHQKAIKDGINVIEGVMGLFDGGAASSANLSRLLSVPVILVVDASSSAESIAAVIKGFETFMADLNIAAIILNRIAGARHLELACTAISGHCRSRLVGALPRDEKLTIASRHLGLFMGEEAPIGRDFSQLSTLIQRHVDMKAVMDIGQGCKTKGNVGPAYSPRLTGVKKRPPTKIAIAKDKAFCFYYQDNLEILELAGASLVPFSPINDSCLPDGICGIYLGGGYPELHAHALSENRSMRQEIKDFSQNGWPIFAECGGFMYLCKSITNLKGSAYDMVGVYPANTIMQKRLSSLGYRKATIKEACPLGKPGAKLFGHEFHYSTTRFSRPVEKAFSLENRRKEGFLVKNTLAGYIHVHLGPTQDAAIHFVDTCRKAGVWRR